MITADRALVTLSLAGAGAVVAFLALRSSDERPAPVPPTTATASAPRVVEDPQPMRCGSDRMRSIVIAPRLEPDLDLVRYIALTSPADLDFSDRPDDAAVRAGSFERFEAWVQMKTDQGHALRARYEAILATASPLDQVLATARIGLLAEGFAQNLRAVPLPVDVRTGVHATEKVEAFCDSMVTVAEPLQARAIEAYEDCARRARSLATDANDSQLRVTVDAAEACFDGLAFAKPETFPALEEMFDAPEGALLRLRLGVVDDIDGVAPYDRENTQGVALRVARDFAGARAAYDRAIALDPARPEAHFNRGLLEQFEANAVVDLDLTRAHYRRAIPDFIGASSRAVGDQRVIAMRHMIDARKALAQLDAFVAAY